MSHSHQHDNQGCHRQQRIQAKYTKIPIVYEATGAIGKEAKNMMKKVMLKLRDQHPSGIPTPSEVGLDSHWGATSFKSHWTQKFATLLAKNRSKVVQEIRFARIENQRVGPRKATQLNDTKTPDPRGTRRPANRFAVTGTGPQGQAALPALPVSFRC